MRFTVDCNSWYRGCLEIINFLFVHLPSWIGSSRSVRLQLSLVFLSISGLEPVVWRLGLVWLGGHFWIVYWRDNQPLCGVLCPYPWSVSNDCALNPFPTCHVLCTVLHLGDLGLLFRDLVNNGNLASRFVVAAHLSFASSISVVFLPDKSRFAFNSWFSSVDFYLFHVNGILFRLAFPIYDQPIYMLLFKSLLFSHFGLLSL